MKSTIKFYTGLFGFTIFLMYTMGILSQFVFYEWRGIEVSREISQSISVVATLLWCGLLSWGLIKLEEKYPVTL